MKIHASLLILAVSTVARAQSVGYVYEPRSKAAYEVVTTKIGTVSKPLGLRMSLSVNGFAGVGFQNRPIGGITLTYSAKLAENVGLEIGPAVFASAGRPSGWGVFAGLSWRF